MYSFELLNSLQHSLDFERPWVKSLLKTLREKEKMLVIHIFSFSHIVFNPIKEKNKKNHLLITFILPYANGLSLVQSKILSFGRV